MTLYESVATWGGPGRNPKVSIFYTDAPAKIAPLRAALTAAVLGQKTAFVSSMNFEFSTEVREIDETTGELTGVGSVTAPAAVSGGTGTNPLPDASQVLLRWRTASVLDGRRVGGRTFIPNVVRDAAVAGNFGSTSAFIGQFGVPAIRDNLVIWSRPRVATEKLPARAGSIHAVVGVDCWSEFAIQRRRRG